MRKLTCRWLICEVPVSVSAGVNCLLYRRLGLDASNVFVFAKGPCVCAIFPETPDFVRHDPILIQFTILGLYS